MPFLRHIKLERQRGHSKTKQEVFANSLESDNIVSSADNNACYMNKHKSHIEDEREQLKMSPTVLRCKRQRDGAKYSVSTTCEMKQLRTAQSLLFRILCKPLKHLSNVLICFYYVNLK